MSQRVDAFGPTKESSSGVIAKASVNSATMSNVSDPKPGELPMGRVKFAEMQMEARTHRLCNISG